MVLYYIFQDLKVLRGAPLEVGGGGGCLAIYIYFTSEMESFLFSPQDRLYFHQAFLFISSMFPTKIFIKITSTP